MAETKTNALALRSNESVQSFSPESLAELRRDKTHNPAFPTLPEKGRLQWLSTQLLFIANTLRIKDYDVRDATLAAGLIDGEIREDTQLSRLSAQEINYAMVKGSIGRYGDFFGLTAKTIIDWLRAFCESSLSTEATAINNALWLESHKQKEQARREEEQRKLRAEIEEAKRNGTFVPQYHLPSIGKPVDTAEADRLHREKVLQQARDIRSGKLVIE